MLTLCVHSPPPIPVAFSKSGYCFEVRKKNGRSFSHSETVTMKKNTTQRKNVTAKVLGGILQPMELGTEWKFSFYIKHLHNNWSIRNSQLQIGPVHISWCEESSEFESFMNVIGFRGFSSQKLIIFFDQTSKLNWFMVFLFGTIIIMITLLKTIHNPHIITYYQLTIHQQKFYM